MDKYVLKLYVAGQTPRSQRAIASVHRICEEQLQDVSAVEVIDVLERPEMGEEAGILATPTLVKQFPLPARRRSSATCLRGPGVAGAGCEGEGRSWISRVASNR